MNWQEAWERDKHKVGRAVHEAWAAEKVRQGFADHAWVEINKMTVIESGAAWSVMGLCGGDGAVTRIPRRGGGDDIELTDGALCDIPKGLHHPDMLDYDDLAPHIQAYDIETGIVGYRFGFEAAQREAAV